MLACHNICIILKKKSLIFNSCFYFIRKPNQIKKTKKIRLDWAITRHRPVGKSDVIYDHSWYDFISWPKSRSYPIKEVFTQKLLTPIVEVSLANKKICNLLNWNGSANSRFESAVISVHAHTQWINSCLRYQSISWSLGLMMWINLPISLTVTQYFIYFTDVKVSEWSAASWHSILLSGQV